MAKKTKRDNTRQNNTITCRLVCPQCKMRYVRSVESNIEPIKDIKTNLVCDNCSKNLIIVEKIE